MERRSFLAALAALPIAACSRSVDAPLPAPVPVPDLYMPDEGDPHARTWMAFTSSTSIWGRSLLAAVQEDLVRIATAIARFEPVTMLVNPDARARAEALLGAPSTPHPVTLVDAALDDLWMRDTGPVFLKSRRTTGLFAADLNFNGWGNKQTHARDAKVAAFVADRAGASLQACSLVLEGGGIEVDGRGTALVKESCVLNPNRNPGVSKAQAEAVLNQTLGLRKILWLPGPAGATSRMRTRTSTPASPGTAWWWPATTPATRTASGPSPSATSTCSARPRTPTGVRSRWR